MIRELQEKYLPLHEIDIDLNLEGLTYGFSDAVREHKHEHAAELAKKRALDHRDRVLLRK